MLRFNEGRKERNGLFYDTLNTFYLRLYGVGVCLMNVLNMSFGLGL